ncbi:hypothetical protein LTR64_002176 [Lithohypha guttulata]|uniref:uncharacterized protein n=1 Tax=Lithohypha guttulata TaxID=1690604 RepID=UPI00315D9103
MAHTYPIENRLLRRLDARLSNPMYFSMMFGGQPRKLQDETYESSCTDETGVILQRTAVYDNEDKLRRHAQESDRRFLVPITRRTGVLEGIAQGHLAVNPLFSILLRVKIADLSPLLREGLWDAFARFQRLQLTPYLYLNGDTNPEVSSIAEIQLENHLVSGLHRLTKDLRFPANYLHQMCTIDWLHISSSAHYRCLPLFELQMARYADWLQESMRTSIFDMFAFGIMMAQALFHGQATEVWGYTKSFPKMSLIAATSDSLTAIAISTGIADNLMLSEAHSLRASISMLKMRLKKILPTLPTPTHVEEYYPWLSRGWLSIYSHVRTLELDTPFIWIDHPLLHTKQAFQHVCDAFDEAMQARDETILFELLEKPRYTQNIQTCLLLHLALCFVYALKAEHKDLRTQTRLCEQMIATIKTDPNHDCEAVEGGELMLGYAHQAVELAQSFEIVCESNSDENYATFEALH